MKNSTELLLCHMRNRNRWAKDEIIWTEISLNKYLLWKSLRLQTSEGLTFRSKLWLEPISPSQELHKQRLLLGKALDWTDSKTQSQ